jgi:hypothetical protein
MGDGEMGETGGGEIEDGEMEELGTRARGGGGRRLCVY